MIPYGKQSISEEDIAEVVRVLRGNWLTSGPDVRAFEDELARVCGARHAVSVANGTAALHVACLAAGVGPGDVGVTSPLTFLASANAIAYCGGAPAFADVDPDSLCLSPEALAAHISERGAPKVVIPVDFAGRAAALPAIRELSRQHGFTVIEDAAHALGTHYTVGRETFSCGSCAHSDMSILSFHPVKTVTTGEGGAVLTNDDALAQRIRRFANHGTERDPKLFASWDLPEGCAGDASEGWLYQQQALGYNYRLTDIHAALGRSQLKRLYAFKQRRRTIVDRYNTAFKDMPGMQPMTVPADQDPCYHLYLLRLKAGAAARRRLYDFLRTQGILSQVHYIPVHLQPWYRAHAGTAPGDFPQSEAAYSSLISLPLFPAMTDAEVETVIAAVGAFAGQGDG